MRRVTSGLTGSQLHFPTHAKAFIYLTDVWSTIGLVRQTRNLSRFTSSSQQFTRVQHQGRSHHHCVNGVLRRNNASSAARPPLGFLHTQFDSLTHKQGSLHKHMEEEKGVTETPGSAPRHKLELHKSRAHACAHVSERH